MTGDDRPAQQVFRLDVAQRNIAMIVINQVKDIGNHFDPRLGLFAEGENLAKVGPADVMDGDDDEVNGFGGGDVKNVVAPTEYLTAFDDHALLVGIIINEADDLIGVAGKTVLEPPGKFLSGLACADDQYLSHFLGEFATPDRFPAPERAADEPGAIARGGDTAHCQRTTDQDHA